MSLPDPSPPPPKGGESMASVFQGVSPEELFARGMQSVRITAGASSTVWEPPTVVEMARLFPHYEILELIGRGGMGAVYKARQIALDRFVAVKLLPLEVSIDRDFAERFVREAKTMARLNHPSIVSVYDFGTTSEGHLFFVMEYIEGTTLHQMIKTVGLKQAQALEIIVAVCEALQFAHDEGVVHRDVKPANVLVDVKGRVKVMDFGLARMDTPDAEQWGHTITGAVLGTPDYMAPEQKSGLRVDHRADIYSLGVMLYEMLCGQVPQGIFDPPSVRVAVDERVDQVVIRAMQQEPDRRYSNTGEMRTEVQTIRSSADQSPRVPVPRVVVPIVQEAAEVPPPTGFLARLNNLPWRMMGGVTVGALSSAAILLWIGEFSRRNAAAHAVTAVPSPLPGMAPAATPSRVPKLPPRVPVANVPHPPAPKSTPANVPIRATPMSSPAIAVTTITPETARPANREPEHEPLIGVAPGAATPAPEVAVNATLLEWNATLAKADAAVRVHDRNAAAEWYQHAISLGESAPGVIPNLEVALLCKKLGQLQTTTASPIEARDTFLRGKRLLGKPKAGPRDPARAKLIGEFDVLIERLRKQTE